MNDSTEKKNKAKLFSFEYLFFDFVKLTAAIPGLIAFRPKIMFENDAAKKILHGGALLIGNHAGFCDPIYMQFCFWYRRHHFICTKEFFQGKSRFFFKNFLCIPIDRDNFGVDTFRSITEHLEKGEVVSMFPEGKIEHSLKSFKSGMVLMALRSGAPIIPIYMNGQKNVLKRLRIAIGEPVDIKKLCGDKPAFSQIEKITQYLNEKEEELRKISERGK